MTDLFSSFETIQKIAEQNNSSRNDGTTVPVLYVYWSNKAGEDKEKIIRLLHQGCIPVPMHEMIRNVQGKYTEAVCLEASMISNKKSCPLCAADNPPKERGYGLAVVREEKIEGEGPNRRAVVRDKMVELEDQETNKKFTQPFIGTIKQGVTNFWNNLAPVSLRYGDVTSRDLQVTRVGSGTSTSYSFLPFDVDPTMDTLEKVLERYKEPMRGKSPQDLILQRLNHKSSDSYYKKQFGPSIFSSGMRRDADEGPNLRAVSNGGGMDEFSADTTSNPGQGQATFSDLRDKLKSYSTTDYDGEPPY